MSINKGPWQLIEEYVMIPNDWYSIAIDNGANEYDS
jgi:hypothetical protein